MRSDCLEFRRLAQQLAQAIVSTLTIENEALRTNGSATSRLLEEARISQQDAERSLNEHIAEHGCIAAQTAAN